MNDATDIAARLAGDLPELPAGAQGPLLAVRAPARSEIAGNHTDHEGGCVIAAGLDRSIDCVARENGTSAIRVFSRGYDPVVVELDNFAPRDDERVSSAALVRGMAAQMAVTDRMPKGFDLVMESDIPSGGGLSSSAAYELALCRAMETLWPGRPVDAVEAAQMAQRVEMGWFGKPCGLMDQLAVSLGGLAYMDFSTEDPSTRTLPIDFATYGHTLVLTDVGCDHTAYTDEYAAVPIEMKAVAQAMGASRLREVDERDFQQRIPELRASLGDRPVLRALHYYEEMRLVDERWEALVAGNLERFLLLARRSGASSGMFLQNVSAASAREQDAMVAIALSEAILADRGATRIHGGGFGGSIQAFVPNDLVDEYVTRMDGWLGEGSAKTYGISQKGAEAQWV